jgi:hypothetical protein
MGKDLGFTVGDLREREAMLEAGNGDGMVFTFLGNTYIEHPAIMASPRNERAR